MAMLREIRRYIVVVFFAFLLSPLCVEAQKHTEYSQYMEFQSAINPAAVGADDLMSVGGIFRLQWAGFSDAPKNLYFSVTYPFRVGNSGHGIGLVFSSDDIGLFKDQSVLLQYSYRFKLSEGEMGFGLNVGFISQTFDKDEADLTGGDGELMSGDEYHQTTDPFIDGFTSEEDSDVAFDVSFGCMYRTDDYYAGVSALHLNAPTVDLGSETYQMYVPRSYHLIGGYRFQTHNPMWEITPSGQVCTDFSTWQAEVTGLFEYNKKVRCGMSYRFGDAFVFLFGMDIIQGLRFCYSYDLPTSRMIRSGGSHEMSLKYSFKPQFSKKNKYKSERIL